MSDYLKKYKIPKLARPISTKIVELRPVKHAAPVAVKKLTQDKLAYKWNKREDKKDRHRELRHPRTGAEMRDNRHEKQVQKLTEERRKQRDEAANQRRAFAIARAEAEQLEEEMLLTINGPEIADLPDIEEESLLIQPEAEADSVVVQSEVDEESLLIQQSDLIKEMDQIEAALKECTVTENKKEKTTKENLMEKPKSQESFKKKAMPEKLSSKEAKALERKRKRQRCWTCSGRGHTRAFCHNKSKNALKKMSKACKLNLSLHYLLKEDKKNKKAMAELLNLIPVPPALPVLVLSDQPESTAMDLGLVITPEEEIQQQLSGLQLHSLE